MRPAAADAVAVLGQRIKIARTERGWTLTELAARIMVSPPTVAAIERGDGSVSIGRVFNAAVVLGVPLFAASPEEVARIRHLGDETVALLPARVRRVPKGTPGVLDH